MEAGQRFMYPQIARGGVYDAAVFGTSTARLIDPKALDAVFPANFANLAMNAATPYEQTRLARLFLQAGPAKAVLFALDAPWCGPDADRRLTALPFPDWLYEPTPSWGLLRQMNGQGVAAAARVALYRLGLAPERIRGDGYAVFTPPEDRYDPVRAAAYIRAGAVVPATAGGAPSSTGADGPMPALAWLDGLLAEMPADALKLVAFMPVHVLAQGQPGTVQGIREAACKAQVAAIGRARGALVVDFRLPSPVTTRDTNYWDALHYRLPVADRIVSGLAQARADGRDDPEGVYRVLARP